MKQNCSYKPMIVEAMLRRSVLPLLLMFMLFQPLTALARTMYGRLNTDTQTLTIYYDDNWQKGDFTIPSYSPPYWRYDIDFKELAKIKTVVFDPSFKDARLKDCSWWFSGFMGLTTITHLEYLNTSQVTNMQCMFQDCESLEALNLSTFNTENVTNMYGMFQFCKSLKSLNLSSFNTSKVKQMEYMFQNCESLTALDLSRFNTENVKNYEHMFHSCKSLTALDLSSFNSKEILNTSIMFSGCFALKTIDISSFDTSKTTDMPSMFSECSALETIYASSAFTTDNVTNDFSMFSNCTKLKNFDESNSGKTHAHIGEGGYFTVAPAWVRFDAATGTLTFQCSSAKTDADTDYFLNEGSDVPGWSKTKSADIKTVVFKRNFRDARPTTCSLWFGSCTNLTSVEGLENLNTSDVTRMDYMFYKCEQLRALDLSGFNTEKVENMRDMFSNCKNLETLNLSSFKTNNLTNMSEMFLECNKIAQLDLSGFNTSGVKALDQVFKRCYALESLDLSSFDTKWVTDMSSLFDNCQSLKTIYVSDRFSTYRVKYSTNMFSYCNNLKGATAFADIQKKDKAQANYTDGYFTKKVGMNGPDIIGATGSPLIVYGLTLSDDKALELYEACNVQDGTYTRPMASTWGTLCLPYVIKPSDRNTCLFYKIETMEDDKVLLTEITQGHILAGTPLVVRKKDDSQKDISIYSEYAMMSTAPSNDNANPLKGTFSTTELTDDCYFIAKNQFRLVEYYKGAATGVNGVKVAGFRAYLQPETTAGSKRADVLSIDIDDEATGIESAEVIDWLNNPSAEYYDLKGRRVEGLQKGINIVKVGKRVKKVAVE